MKNIKHKSWKATCIAAIILATVTFTPLVIPYNQLQPMLGNLPYTLWVGILIYLAMVVLTFIGTRVYPDNDKSSKS
jgi:sterol desaturase/sphingolipid hydroxylase (fatty acid hydroxylase superfamily)